MRQENKKNLLNLLYNLRSKEVSNLGFSSEILALETGYKESSIKKYLSSFLPEYCFFNKEDSQWYCNGIASVNDYDFLCIMSQNRTNENISDEDKLIANLIKKSRGSCLTAIQLFNSPNQISRVELFAILMINSWELLLKACIVKHDGSHSIYKKDDTNTISCRSALKKLYTESDNVRVNIETIIHIRDQATHLTISELQNDLSRPFQSTILNYIKKFKELTGVSPLPDMNAGLLNLIIESSSPNIAIIKHKYGEKTANIVNTFLTQLKNQTSTLNSLEFSIPLEYKIYLTKKKSESDITFTDGATGNETLKLYVPINPADSHPYKTTPAIEAINELITPNEIKSGTFYKIVKKYDIRKKSEYFYSNENVSRYSESFISWCATNIIKHPGWLGKIKSK